MIKRTLFIQIAIVAALVSLGFARCAQADNAPRRIVSFNLCADQLLLALADPSQIAGLSPYANDPALSVTTSEAAKYPRLDWSAESVVSTAPDLVLAGPSDRPTRSLLGAMGMRVVEVSLVSDVAAATAQVRAIGLLVGHPERSEKLAAQIRQAKARLAATAFTPPRTAMIVQRGGYTEGPDSLVAAMLSIAGLRPPVNSANGFGGFVSMEQLLIDGPDVLVMQDPPRDASDQGALFITHPALLARYGPQRRIDLPARYTLCGGPALLQGLDFLNVKMNSLK